MYILCVCLIQGNSKTKESEILFTQKREVENESIFKKAEKIHVYHIERELPISVTKQCRMHVQ